MRWKRATGETLAAASPTRIPSWPKSVEPTLTAIRAGVSRTSAKWRSSPEVRECGALHLQAIGAARQCVYMENQYFTSPVIARAPADRLEEPRGPEVVLISAEHSPSYFDQFTMDKTRSTFIHALKDADRHHRFRIYSPVTTLGRTIIVHAKLTIIDDTLLRIGSANINNRSMGFDTECDLSLEAQGPNAAANRAGIRRARTHLLAHWLGWSDVELEAAIRKHGGVGSGLEALRLRGYCRLRPIEAQTLRPIAQFVASHHMGDPVGPDDSWRPWCRRQALTARLKQMHKQATASVKLGR